MLIYYKLYCLVENVVMRIVFVTNNYTPYSGGVVSSINASVTALHKAGH